MMNAEALRAGTWPQADEDLLARYMRSLLRRGSFEDLHAGCQDVRTCTHCGAYARFDPAGVADSWAACSACGALA